MEDRQTSMQGVNFLVKEECKGPLILNGLIHLLEHSNTSFEAR